MEIEISYGQIAVFDARLSEPFNDWTDEHVKQGFAWRPGSVSFGTLRSEGLLSLDISRTKFYDPGATKATRVLRVPFTVPFHGEVEVASIGQSFAFDMEPAHYELTYEHGETNRMWANLLFRKVNSSVAALVLRTDSELSPENPLIMTAEPA